MSISQLFNLSIFACGTLAFVIAIGVGLYNKKNSADLLLTSALSFISAAGIPPSLALIYAGVDAEFVLKELDIGAYIPLAGLVILLLSIMGIITVIRK